MLELELELHDLNVDFLIQLTMNLKQQCAKVYLCKKYIDIIITVT